MTQPGTVILAQKMLKPEQHSRKVEILHVGSVVYTFKYSRISPKFKHILAAFREVSEKQILIFWQ